MLTLGFLLSLFAKGTFGLHPILEAFCTSLNSGGDYTTAALTVRLYRSDL